MTVGAKPNYLNFGLFTLLSLWSAGYFYLIGLRMLANDLFFTSSGNGIKYSDYLLWYMSGQLAYSESRSHLYDTAVQLAWWNNFLSVAKVHIDSAPAFHYPPYFALMMLPFGLISVDCSYVLWSVITMVCGWAALAFLFKREMKADRIAVLALLIGATASFPSWLTLRIGHLAWFVLIIFSVWYFGFVYRKDKLTGVMLALLSIKPQLMLYILIPSVWGKRWMTLAAFLCTEVFLRVISGFIFGWDGILNYPNMLVYQESNSHVVGVNPASMPNLRGLLSRILSAPVAFGTAGAIMFVGIIVLLIIWTKAFRSSNRMAIRWAVCLTILISLITTVHVHEYDSLLLALLAAVTLPTVSIIECFKKNFDQSLSMRIWCGTLIFYPLIGCLLFLQAELKPNAILESATILIVNIVLLVAAAFNFRHSLDVKEGSDLLAH